MIGEVFMKHIDFANILMIMLAAVTLSVSCGGAEVVIAPVLKAEAQPRKHHPESFATEGQYTSSVRIEWDAVDGAEYYVIYKSVDNRTSFV
jgi:hypothetical protein